jgi:hypothetical protein
MKLQRFFRLFLWAVLLLQAAGGFAFETDQYNLPREPLADIGDEVSEYAEENLRKALVKINNEIFVRQSCLSKTIAKSAKTKCGSPQTERARLDYLRSEAAVARQLYNLVGAGFRPLQNREAGWNRTDSRISRRVTKPVIPNQSTP